jgi:transposase
VPTMPQAPTVRPAHHESAEADDVVVGVDTHKAVHVAAVVNQLGVLLGSAEFPTTSSGYQQLLSWARGFGQVRRAGVECTGSYGAALARYLAGHQVEVIEVNQPDKRARRRGKTDAIDAEAAARAVLSGRAATRAKAADGPVEMVRVFKLAKASATKSRTQAINQLKSVLVSADPELREAMSGLSNTRLIRRCADLSTTDSPATITGAAAYTIALLARRILELTSEINDLRQRIHETLTAHAPQLLARHGVGPDTAAALLIAAGDNPQRLHHEGSFAALCGVSPVEASSGKTQRHRLNRGGDRQANCALHTIVLSRLRWDPRSRDYLARRIAQGKTRREALRCLKRYVAREVHQLIAPREQLPPSAAA